MTAPRPHALIYVTGWLLGSGEGARLHGLPVTRSPAVEQHLGTRVTAVLRIVKSHLSGRVIRTSTQNLRLAREGKPNGMTFSASGKLHRFDASTDTVTLRLPPPHPDQLGTPIHLRCVRQVFATVNPEWRQVRVSGGLLNGILVIHKISSLHNQVDLTEKRGRL